MFKDREDAGRRLGEALRRFADERPILLGLARGGVIVAAEAARVLGAETDVLVVRKVSPPGNREFGVGAVAPDGIVVFDERAIQATGVSPTEIERRVVEEREEMERRIAAYRGGNPAPEVEGRCAIVVDDGLATGATAIAALRYVRTLSPAQLVLAVPVLSGGAFRAVEPEADETVFLELPDPFWAVGQAYEAFGEVSDDEVRAALGRAELP